MESNTLKVGLSSGLLLLFLLFPATHGYHSGAPRSACTTLRPDHSPNRPQQVPTSGVGSSPFTIRFSLRPGQEPARAPPGAVAYEPGQLFDVTLTASSDTRFFRGFMLAARRVSGNQDLLGSFASNTRSSMFRTTCSDQAITHRNAGSKTTTTARWQAPSTPVGDIVFVSSFVKEYELYWNLLKSDVLYDASAIPVPTTVPAPAGFNTTDLCQETALEPLVLQRPHVAILCNSDANCPCGWRCCAECVDEVTQTCSGYAICRKPRQMVEVEIIEEN